MKLLLVTDAVGGVWVYSLELARALRSLGVETVLAIMGPSPTAEQRKDARGFKLVDTGLPLDWLETSPGALRSAGRTLSEIAAREAVDVVQTPSAALLAEVEFTQPVVAVQHSCVASWWAAVKNGPLPNEFEWRRELVEAGLNRASVVIAPSVAFAAETARTYDLSAPVLAVHNGRRSPAARVLPQGNFVFTASRLWDEGKNVATLDRAAGRLDVAVAAAGETHGPNGACLKPRNLDLLGEVRPERMAGLLSLRPIYASAALYEPFGLSVLEAAQAGCALVLSDIATHRELWDGAARFVPARDEEGFADAIRCLIGDREQRADLGSRARARARRYSPEAMASRMEAIYSRLLPDAAPAAVEMADVA